jgi:predicted membrane protein
VKATLGIGNLLVRIPENVTVQVDGRAGAGEVNLFGTKNQGSSVHDETIAPGTDAKRVLVLDAHVGLGGVEVERG